MNKVYSVHHRNNVNIFVSNPIAERTRCMELRARARARSPSHTCIIGETIIHASAFVWQIYCVDNANSLPTHGAHTRICALSDCDETTCSFSMRQRAALQRAHNVLATSPTTRLQLIYFELVSSMTRSDERLL